MTTTIREATVDEGFAEASAVEPKRRIYRKRYWVLPMLQTRLIVLLIAGSAVVATTAAWVVLLVVWAPLGDLLVTAGGEIRANELFVNALWRVLATTALLVALFGLVSLLTGIIISHRIAGPLHRVGMIVDQVCAGQYSSRFTLRRGDYIPDVAQKINRMLEHVEQTIRRQRQAVSLAHKSLSEMESASLDGKLSSPETERRLRELLLILQEVRLSEPSDDETPSA